MIRRDSKLSRFVSEIMSIAGLTHGARVGRIVEGCLLIVPRLYGECEVQGQASRGKHVLSDVREGYRGGGAVRLTTCPRAVLGVFRCHAAQVVVPFQNINRPIYLFIPNTAVLVLQFFKVNFQRLL